jgi:putative transposase
VRFNREKHRRRSIRLLGYDYTQAGAYFVTICTQGRECLFGEIVDREMRLNDAGRMVHSVWEELPRRYTGMDIDAFVAMPNHIHGIIILRDHHVVGATPRGCPTSGQAQGPAPTMSLPDVVHRFKSLTTARYPQGVAEKGWPPFCRRLWQRNYYEHVIRGEDELDRIRRYIEDNPLMWAMDRENPAAQVTRGRESWQV